MPLEILTDDSLAPLRHGFFTRQGGASSGIYKGLNCGSGSDDQSEIVAINRARVANAMEVPAGALCGVYQVHSADVVTVTEPTTNKPKADALVTATKGVALSILTADCQPVLFADSDAQVIGAAHAGWKGAKAGILANTVSAMEALGAKRDNIIAVIGPSISQQNYEVGPEFRDKITIDDAAADRHFLKGQDDRLLFDLPAYGIAQLKAAGVRQARWVGRCTYADTESFYSYRRSVHWNEPDYGRLISAISM